MMQQTPEVPFEEPASEPPPEPSPFREPGPGEEPVPAAEPQQIPCLPECPPDRGQLTK